MYLSLSFVPELAGLEIVSRILATFRVGQLRSLLYSVDHMVAAPADNLLFRCGYHWLFTSSIRRAPGRIAALQTT